MSILDSGERERSGFALLCDRLLICDLQSSNGRGLQELLISYFALIPCPMKCARARQTGSSRSSGTKTTRRSPKACHLPCSSAKSSCWHAGSSEMMVFRRWVSCTPEPLGYGMSTSLSLEPVKRGSWSCIPKQYIPYCGPLDEALLSAALHHG
jgi:hypothetical protein